MNRLNNYFAKNFYTNVPSIFHWVGIFVIGDIYVLAPFILVFFPIVFVIKGLWGLAVAWCLYMGMRNFIEIIYWLFHQFGDKSYRPPFQSKKFGNNDVYIIYQLMNTTHSVVYFTILIFLIVDR